MTTTAKMLRDLYRDRVARGVCRHCGGSVPCWSQYGDRAVGKKHTETSWLKSRSKP